MPEVMLQGLRMLVQALEIVGAGALVLGFVITTLRCFLEAFRQAPKPALERYRKSLGRVILIGLEILVAATIIKTITLNPTLENLGLLSFMVVIRTILSWAMVLEMKGRWPWQRAN